MRASDLTRKDELDAGEQGMGSRHPAFQPRVEQHQHAALGFRGADQLAGAQELRPEVFPAPQVGPGLAFGLRRELLPEHFPQRGHVELGQARQEVVDRVRMHMRCVCHMHPPVCVFSLSL